MAKHRDSSPVKRRIATVAVVGLVGAAVLASVPAQATAASSPVTVTITVGDPAKPSGPPVAPFGFALTSAKEIVTFSLADPSRSAAKAITGLPVGSTVVGIDERPKTGTLYAVVKAANGNGSAYTITPATGVATKAFDLVNISPGTSGPVQLDGVRFGVDFNPSADALRITSNTGQNLRALPSDRVVALVNRFAGDTFTDGTLNYAGTTASGIEASAYTNNVAITGGATALYNVDAAQSQLTLQNPPNNGTQVLVAPLLLNSRPVAGLDIATTSGVDTAYLATANNTVKAKVSNPLEALLVAAGLAKVREYPVVNLSTLSLTTGALTSVGNFFNNTVVDFTVDTPAP